ncbi:MAG: hypothetical protein HKN76_19155, partial [Saprospiraceae bacterium]|nr:hypothetical protein [Saprospiraceae bacterium]
MRSLQKISAWGLVSSLLLPFIIGWCILTIEERSVEQNVSHLLAAGIETSLLTVIRIAKEDQQILRWEREDEFEYRGEMYDVVARSESSDSLTFHCWHDVDESEVKEKIQHFLARLKG